MSEPKRPAWLSDERIEIPQFAAPRLTRWNRFGRFCLRRWLFWLAALWSWWTLMMLFARFVLDVPTYERAAGIAMGAAFSGVALVIATLYRRLQQRSERSTILPTGAELATGRTKGGDDGYERAIEVLRDDGTALFLVGHQRMDIKGCLCGWTELGKSHSRHVVDALADHLAALAPRRE